jgi:hypothetical protein
VVCQRVDLLVVWFGVLFFSFSFVFSFCCCWFVCVCEVGEGSMTELAVVVSCLVVVLPSGGSEWFNGVDVGGIDASEGGFLDHGSPVRLAYSTAIFVKIDGSMKQAGGQVNFVFIEDPICTL